MILVGERARASAGKLKSASIDCGKKIPRATRNHLARAAKTQASEKQRPATFVANGSAIAATSVQVVGHSFFAERSR
jgi:hypothetical protein